MTAQANIDTAISSPLEDYLETIYLLVRESGFARVKDIAKARGVKAATVSIALRKLSEGGLVHYERREYIGLTARGEEVARRVITRHRLLTRFFEEVLEMSPRAADAQACSLEHNLTDDAVDRLARFFEFLGSCRSASEVLHSCRLGLRAAGDGDEAAAQARRCAKCAKESEEKTMSIAEMKPGQTATVTRIVAKGAVRRRLLDMGILPQTTVDLERTGLGGDPLWIRCQGARLALRGVEAKTVLVSEDP